MRRTGRLLIAIGGVAALLAIGDGADARPRFPGAVFGLLRAPLGVLGIGHGRHSAYRHRSARHVIARARHRYAPAMAAGGLGAAALAGRAAWTGPVFWPAAYEDMFGYAAGPTDMRFWSDGFADVFAGIFGQPGSDERASARPRSQAVQTVSDDDRTTGAARSSSEQKPCGTPTSQSVDDFMSQIEQTVRPKPAQQAALNDLRSTMTRAADDVRRACPHETPLTPLARLDAMQQRLWAMQSAALLVRTPFAKFVATLDDEQKARLDGSPQAAQAAPAPRANTRRHARADAQAESQAQMASGAPVQICYMQSRAASAQPYEQIAERVRPTQDQQASLKALAETSGNMAKLMLASCPDKPPANALARIDAVLGRLEAMLYAINVVNPPLQEFYGSLSDEQKARFNSLGGAASAS